MSGKQIFLRGTSTSAAIGFAGNKVDVGYAAARCLLGGAGNITVGYGSLRRGPLLALPRVKEEGWY